MSQKQEKDYQKERRTTHMKEKVAERLIHVNKYLAAILSCFAFFRNIFACGL